jgi:L-alanine-DL-glutamate epimerase-like enolase superfamily enzyme
MKISRLDAVPLVIPFSHGAGARKQLDFCLVRVETDEGLVGWGEAFAYSCRSAVAAVSKPLALR